MAGSFIEQLDRRILLSAQLTGGTLALTGTDGADDIAVMADPTFINVLDAKVNGTTSYYSLATVTLIQIDALGGDDRITIDPALDAIGYQTSINGGAGNDRITTGAGADTIDAGDGNDKVYANGGADLVMGGAGNDTIYGGDGDDTLLGGNGNDRLMGEDGQDVFDGGKSNNYVDGGAGNDVIKEKVGSDTVFAGPGDDSGSFKGGGIVDGEDGKDTFVSTGSALLYGGKGNDNLQGASVWGGAGDDTLAGLNGADEIHGGDGNDLIRGMDGNDSLLGEGGDDAIFGGGGTDTLYGGDGNDNLYGTNGAKDKHRDLDGTDDGYGGDGSDWFETDYPWRKGDYQKGVDRAVGAQNPLTQDPDVGLYSGGTLTIGSNNGGGSISLSGSSVTGAIFQTTNPWKYPSADTAVTQQLGKIGYLSTGVFDFDAFQLVPPALTHAQRLAIRSGIVQLDSGWHLGAMTSTADNVVWYALTGGGEFSDGMIWRFLAVKRGTVLIDQQAQSILTGTEAAKVFDLSTRVLSLASSASIFLAGSATVYHAADTFDSLPTGGPANSHGILLSGGVIWLPGDGTAPTYDPLT